MVAVRVLAPKFVEVMQQTFQVMDIVFYAIGAYFGFKYAATPLAPKQAVEPTTPQ